MTWQSFITLSILLVDSQMKLFSGFYLWSLCSLAWYVVGLFHAMLRFLRSGAPQDIYYDL